LFRCISQHALAVVVEVYEEAKSVLLPCQYSGIIPEKNPTVMWTRSDLSPTFVHLRREEGDDLKKQNLRYSGRTSMRPDALETSDFSLTLRKPELIDSGVYTCSISGGKEETGQRDVQLKVKGQQLTATDYLKKQLLTTFMRKYRDLIQTLHLKDQF
uniref:Ig-like domain-containing protein n=1 Tax=Neolamprologus brichardi TaxID=32507 RepID=A0A3Q4GNI6_NEOBR